MSVWLFYHFGGPADPEGMWDSGAVDQPEEEGRTFMQVLSEKYSPENFPYRRWPGMGVVVVPTLPQGSPMKGEDFNMIHPQFYPLNSVLKTPLASLSRFLPLQQLS